MKSKEMSLEDAKIIAFGDKKVNKKIWNKYETPYDTAIMVLKKDPESAQKLKEKGMYTSTIVGALAEAGIIGLSRTARFNDDRDNCRRIIADRIKQIRQINKLTQEEISRIIDWNTLTYRGYENCKSDVPMVILLRLAEHYKVSMDYLSGRTESFRDKVENDRELEQRIAKLENMVKNLSE